MRHAGAARFVRFALLACLLAVTAACTAKILYRHADWLLLWQLDRHFSLTGEQDSFLSARLEALLARHRQEELPRYEAFLSDIQIRVARGLVADDIEWAIARYQELRADLFAKMVDDGVTFLATVTDEQVQYVRERFRAQDEKKARDLARDRQERLRKRAERTVDWLEDWLGSLTVELERRITELSLALPDTLPAWLDYQRDRRRRFLDLLAIRADRAELTRRLREWLVEPERHAPPAYRDASPGLRAAVAQMAVAIDRLATPEQRRHALAELQELIETIRELQQT